MKVLWILPGSQDSKVNMVFARRTIPWLEKSGVKVLSFYLTSRSNPVALFRLWKQARNTIKNEKPNLVHGQYGSVAGLFSCLLAVPAVVTFRGSDVNGDPDLSLFRQVFSTFTSQLAAFFSKASIFVSEPLKNRLFFPGWKSFVLPSPISIDNFLPMNRKEARAKLNLQSEDKIISFMSSGGRGLKRPELAKAVCDELLRRGHKVKFLQITGVEPKDIPIWLNASDCMLFTSLREGSPNAVREALACGVPVVSVLVGDVEKWISQDSFSRISSDSVKSLADNVEQVWNLSDPRFCRVDFSEISLEKHVNALKQIYSEALK